MKINWKYPLLFSIDLKSSYKSIWLGWWLITWTTFPNLGELCVSFQPGL
jgi:hypothetical protein